MVIAQVIGDLRIGGAERLFVDLANSLSAEKVVVVLINPEPVEPNLEESLAAHIELVRLPITKKSALRGIPRLARLFKDRKVQVVHTHMFWANLYGSLAALIARVPVVVTSEHGRNEWKRPWQKWLEARLISRIAYRRLCVSRDILERRRDVDGVPAALLCLVPNGTTIPPDADAVGHDSTIIGSVGRLVPEKDFPTLVRAIDRLLQQGYECRLELVGDGPSRADIEAAIEAGGLGNAVMLAGTQKNVDAWLRRWTIFASSSIQEGQPVALLEAMAHALPCVATAVGGVPDTLADEREGIVVPPRDVDALAAALARLLDDPALRRKLGSEARERVKRDFSVDSLAARCLGIYRNGMEAGAI